MAHFCLDVKTFKSVLENEVYSFNTKLVSMQRNLRTFLDLLKLDYDTIF